MRFSFKNKALESDHSKEDMYAQVLQFGALVKFREATFMYIALYTIYCFKACSFTVLKIKSSASVSFH